MASQSDIEAAVDQAWSRLRQDFSDRYDTLIRDMERLRSDLTVQRSDLSTFQQDLALLRSENATLRFDLSTASNTSHSSRRQLVEPAVVPDLRFSGDSKTLDGFLITIYDVMEANTQCFASDSRKISWVAWHFASGSPALDWWVSQLQENARAHARDHPDAPRLAGTYSVAGVAFTIPILVDIDLFLCTLAKTFSDPYASQTALQDFQSFTMGKLSVIQFNAKFTALAFRINAPEDILMDYYRKALHPAVYRRALSRADWAPCVSLQELMQVAILAAHQEEAISSSHRLPSSSLPTSMTGVRVPQDSVPMDVSAVNSHSS